MKPEYLERSKWSQTLSTLFVGTVFTLFSVPFYFLDYILPMVGYPMLLSSLRTLKQENDFFKTCYLLVFVRFLLFFKKLILSATLLRSNYSDFFSSIELYSTLFGYILVIFFLYKLRTALLFTQAKVGTSHKLKSITLINAGYIIGLFLLLFLRVLPEDKLLLLSILIILVLLCSIFSFCMFFFFYRELKPFHAMGDFVELRESKISNRTFVRSVVALMLVAPLLAHHFFHVHPMNWTEQNAEQKTGELPASELEQAKQIRERLSEKGFPSEVLQEISNEDILACKDAVKVASQKNEDDAVYFRDTEKLKFYSVIVELPKQRPGVFRYKVFHYFAWSEPHNYCGSECVVGIPGGTRRLSTGEEGGKLMYSEHQHSYSAPFYQIEKLEFDKLKFSKHAKKTFQEKYLASFSLQNYERASGYLTYLVDDYNIDEDYFEAEGIYVYQRSSFVFPLISAKESYLKNGLFSNSFDDLFATVRISKRD